jgi:acyl-CoA reductase-like NAD-dependent aldehyde dehydrogenase
MTMNINWIDRANHLNIQIRSFVGGRYQPQGGDSIKKFSPRDGRLLVQFGTSEVGQVEEAVAAARHAFDDGRWSKRSVQERKDVLYRLAALIDEHLEEIALLESLDVGKTITDALTIDVPAASAIIRGSAEAADKFYGDVYGVDHSSLTYQLRRPIGVVGGIVGWNFPLVLAAQKIGPALATGNSLVLKPSEITSLSTARIAELAMEAGLPEGVFNVIHGAGLVGSALARHRDVDLITFTGSSHTGKRLLIASGESNMKRLILECGGKAPNIIFDDSPNLEGVADAIVARAFWNQGQVCTASSRILIQDSIKNELLPLIIKKAAALNPQDPLKAESKFGALASEAHRQKVLGYIDSGEKEGASVAYRSEATPPFEKGFYVPPVIFNNVSPKNKIATEEIFGPVLSVISFRDEEEAIKIANDTLYGLSAIVWTQSLGRAHRMTHGVKVGWIVVNATEKPEGGTGGSVMSVGGHKESGLGSEGGLAGLEEYTTSTAVQVFV